MDFKPFKQGKFLFLERLASGGMAEVYRARAAGAGGFSKLLAVKRILPNYSQNDEFQKMFEYEARLSGQLTHANIAQTFDFVKSGDVYLLSMEFVNGKNLRQFINKTKKSNLAIAIPLSVYVINEAAKGLDYAHKKKDENTGRPLNIIHRDMSPQNIMCSYEGSIKIVDFGIAKAKDKVDETRSGVIKGKFGYMSPEQANGDSVDARSDVFSTVIILWEMLTGVRLFTAENDLATLKMIQECQITPPSKINPNVKPELERIVLKGLTKDVSLRYSDASLLSRDLQNYLSRYYPTFSQKDVAEVLEKVFKEEIQAEKSRWEEALRQSITFSQGANVEREPDELDASDGDVTRSETGADTIITSVDAIDGAGDPKDEAGVLSRKEHTLMDFDSESAALNPSMMSLEEPLAPPSPKTKPPVLPSRSPAAHESGDDKTVASEDELVTPSPFPNSISTQPSATAAVSHPSLNKADSGISDETADSKKRGGVFDPEVVMAGQSGRGSISEMSKMAHLDFRVSDPDTRPESPGRTVSSQSISKKKNLSGENSSAKGRQPPTNVYLDEVLDSPKKSKTAVFLALVFFVMFIAGGGALYQQGGLPALLKRLSERAPADSATSVSQGGPPGGSFKAPTTTADEHAKNQNQCILKTDSDPRGATVTVGAGAEEKKGVTPTTFVFPCGATTVVTVLLSGYQMVSDNVVITKRTDERYWTLRRIPKGVVRLILSQNANVSINGQFVRYLPAREPFEVELTARKGHRFEFKNEVLGIEQAREIDVEPDVTREERISLEEKTKH